jgi:hypothetical protein
MILISVVMMEVAAISSATKGAQFTDRPVLCLARDWYIIGLTFLVQYGCLLIAIEQDTHILPSPVVACNNNNNKYYYYYYYYHYHHHHHHYHHLSQRSASVHIMYYGKILLLYLLQATISKVPNPVTPNLMFIASISLKYNQQDETFSRSIYFLKLLYMFQAIPPPIIRSTKLCVQHEVLSN